MTAVIIISIIILIIFTNSSKKKTTQPKTINTNNNPKQKAEKKVGDAIAQINIKSKVNVITSSFSNNHNDDAIIDITNKPVEKIINEETDTSHLPYYWKNKYIYSYNEIYTATPEQRDFYTTFKQAFLANKYIKLNYNTNYLYILLYDLFREYEGSKDLKRLEQLTNRISLFYPETKQLAQTYYANKSGDTLYTNSYNQSNYDIDYWKLGSKYKDKLSLNEDEVKLLNKIWYPSNNFCNIEFCCIEISKLYLNVIAQLKSKYIEEGTDLEKQFSEVASIIAKKHFKYREGSENYKYCLESTTKEFFSNIFKHCENAVREFYGHKRKINTDTYYTTAEAKTEFETKIVSKVIEVLPILVLKVSQPDEAINIELYSQNTNRWKIKFEELTTSYNGKPQEFNDSIISLGKLNKKNPSIENIFFEASKFIAKYDNGSALSLYIHYLYHDLKSSTFDNKQLTKTIQKSLFKTNEQLHDFEIIVSELIKDKDLDKALKSVSKVYEVKRKKIQLDKASITEVQKQHSGTVELLNEYLKDDFEDENNTIKSQEINNEEIKIEITQKKEEVNYSAFVSELSFTPIHTTVLELFVKSNFSVSQSELEIFAKSKGVFKSQLIESINDNCYEFLDDVLIEEEDDYYTINTNYFQRISTK